MNNENSSWYKKYNNNQNMFFTVKNGEIDNELKNNNEAQMYNYSFNLNSIEKSKLKKTIYYISLLKDPKERDTALKKLNKRRDVITNLAGLLWHSIGTIAILLQEIISVYQNLTPNNLTQKISERTCNVLGLFQCISLDNETRPLFLMANLPFYLYPLINTSPKQRPFEHIRVTALGVIGALVKAEDPNAISFLMKTELVVLCLKIMKMGNDLSRTVATFIVQKILLDKHGLEYICEKDERLFHVSQILKGIVEEMKESNKTDQRLFRHIIRCFLRLSENVLIISKLIPFIPECLIKKTIEYNDRQILKWHNQLLNNIKIAYNA